MIPDDKKEAPKGITAPRAGTTGSIRHEVTSCDLLGGGREIRIRHAGEVYTLRQTSKGKLILTK